MDATRELLDAGTFHEATVEEVAKKAGVSRATLYQHFPSRLDLVDTICDTFAENPALVSVRESVELPDLDEALEETIGNTIRFWSSEYAILRQLYGARAVDPARMIWWSGSSPTAVPRCRSLYAGWTRAAYCGLGLSAGRPSRTCSS